MRPSARLTQGAGLVWAMGLIVVGYATNLALPGNGLGLPVAIVLGLLAVWTPVVACWLAVSTVASRRWEVLFAAAAVTSYAAGGSYYGVLLARGGPVPFPSPADVGFLAFYPLMLAALVVTVLNHVRGLAWSVFLDCAVGSLGAAAVLAVVLRPVLDPVLRGSPSVAAMVAAARPMGDLLVMAAAAGIAALGSKGMGSRWAMLVGGLLVFAAADVVYALRVTAGVFVAGTPLDAGFAVGLALVAAWVLGAAQPDAKTRQQMLPVTGAAALAISSVAAAAGLGVLLVSSRMHLSTLAVTLAGATLVAAVARTQLSYRQLAWMSDLRRRDATTDELTGLPNRRALYAEGHARLMEPQSPHQALLMLDLDKFKEVNDSLGHHAGDQLLTQVASRLRQSLREGDVLARLGGDEFAVLLEDAGHDEAADVAVKLRAALAEPFTVEDITVHISVSLGISLFPDDGPDLGFLLRKADIAMYKAKTSGSGHHIYLTADDADQATRLQTLEELRTALADEQLVVHYQPKVDLATGEVHGVEALVRWDHPTRGLLYPASFLNLAEESRLMPSLTQVVLTVALDQVAAWHAQGQPLTVAVNLSASRLVDADLPQQVTAMLAARSLPPQALRLEITEDFLMADRDRARAILTRLRGHGVEISIDDFGTGYSSLGYLRDLPIDELKLDRSFVFPMADDARAAALVASTIALAHSLGLRMVAEGVETEVAFAELTRLGCDEAQGFFISRPVPAAELDYWLSNRRAVRQSR